MGPFNADYADTVLTDDSGNYPFTTPEDFTTPFVAAWWNHFEAIIAAAQARGIIVSIAVLYFGFGGDCWGPVMAAKSAAEHQTYGAAVAARLAVYRNIIFEGMGDSTPPEGTRTSSLAAGLRSAGPARLLTAQPQRGVNSDNLQPSGGNWDIQFCYAFLQSYELCATAYSANVGPLWVGEPYYEWRTSPTTTVRNVREQGWWAATSGSPNMLYGNERIYNFDHPFFDQNDPVGQTQSYTLSLNDPGRLQFKALGDFIRSIQWWRLVPDTGTSLITSGRGTSGTASYVTVAKSSGPQNLALLYIPSGASITVAMSGFSGPVTVEYVDPTSGARTPASGSPFAASGSQSFNASSAKGNNSAGDPDWGLLLTS